MLKRFRLRKTARKLAEIGSLVDTTYMVEVNNEPASQFSSYDDVLHYLQNFRDNNVIFHLKIYRVVVYSL